MSGLLNRSFQSYLFLRRAVFFLVAFLFLGAAFFFLGAAFFRDKATALERTELTVRLSFLAISGVGVPLYIFLSIFTSAADHSLAPLRVAGFLAAFLLVVFLATFFLPAFFLVAFFLVVRLTGLPSTYASAVLNQTTGYG